MYKYEKDVIRNVLLNWLDIVVVAKYTENENLLVLKADIEMALKQNERISRGKVMSFVTLNTMLYAGEMALHPSSRVVQPERLEELVDELYYTLNVEGLY